MKRALLLLVFVVACSSNRDAVCENTGACSKGGSSDFIASCKQEARLLDDEASLNGCGGVFDDYYACADDAFTCTGNVTTFPGCDAKRDLLTQCLSRANASTACAKLQAATRACGDAGDAPIACTPARDCQAQCYLDHVDNECAPRVGELAGVTDCSKSCPP